MTEGLALRFGLGVELRAWYEILIRKVNSGVWFEFWVGRVDLRAWFGFWVERINSRAWFGFLLEGLTHGLDMNSGMEGV